MSGKDEVTRTGLNIFKKSDENTAGGGGTTSSKKLFLKSSRSVQAKSSISEIKTKSTAVQPTKHVGSGISTTRIRQTLSSILPFKGKGKGKTTKKVIEKKKEPPTPRKSEALNTEFFYYLTTLKVLLPTLTKPNTKEIVNLWMKKLYQPAYQTSALREKRNKFLLALLITTLNDEVFGWFSEDPPDGAIPQETELKLYEPPECAWEVNDMWAEVLQTVPTTYHITCECAEACGKENSVVYEFLDEEFKLLLHLVLPYVEYYECEEEKSVASQWIQQLCAVTKTACTTQKGIRNDYMMALYGYVCDLRLAGPFISYPQFEKTIPSLAEVTPESCCYIDPSGSAAEEFMKTQPIPEEGAFCYVALAGDLLSTNAVV